MRDAEERWASARRAFEDESTRYLFFPYRVVEAGLESVARDLRKHGLARRPAKDARIWQTVCATLLQRWAGDPLKMVEAACYNAPRLLDMVRRERGKGGFPYLGGDKISALWVRMLRDNVGLPLQEMDSLPIPTDIHVVRATLTTGVIAGQFVGTLEEARKMVERAWSQALAGSGLAPLDIDEPLWHLSRHGCHFHPKDECLPRDCPRYDSCPVAGFCVPGTVVVTQHGGELRTEAMSLTERAEAAVRPSGWVAYGRRAANLEMAEKRRACSQRCRDG